MPKRLILAFSIVFSTFLFLPENVKASDSYIYQELETYYSGSSKCISERNIQANSYPIKSSSLINSAYCTLFYFETNSYSGKWVKVWEGRIQATRQSNLDLSYIIKTPPATTFLSPNEYGYRFGLCEDPNAQTSRQLTSPSSQSCRRLYVTSVGATITKTPQQTTNPTPQQTTNPTPQQTTNPTPQQTTNPTPQQTTNPTPQQTTNPTPQQTTNPTPQQTSNPTNRQWCWGVPCEMKNENVKGKTLVDGGGQSRLALYNVSEVENYNNEQFRSLRNSLVSKSKKSKQTECGNYEILGNVFGDKLVNEDCWNYQPAALNSITGQVSERTLFIDSPVTIPGTTRIQVTFTKYGTKKQKTISSKNYKIVLGDIGANFTSIINLPEYVGESGNLKGIIRLKISNDSIKGKKSITKRLN
jgi:hypothetical protein